MVVRRSLVKLLVISVGAAASRILPAQLALAPVVAVIPVLVWAFVRAAGLYAIQDWEHPLARPQLTALPLLALMVLSLNVIVSFVVHSTLFLADGRVLRRRAWVLLCCLVGVLHALLFVLLWQGLGGTLLQGVGYGLPSAVVILVWDLLWRFRQHGGRA